MSLLSKHVRSKIIFYACGPALLLIADLSAQQKPTIGVVCASYGLNLSSSALGNTTEWVKSACDTKRSCLFAVKSAVGAFAGRNSQEYKDFDFAYRCGDKVKSGHLGADSSRKTVLLTCAD